MRTTNPHSPSYPSRVMSTPTSPYATTALSPCRTTTSLPLQLQSNTSLSTTTSPLCSHPTSSLSYPCFEQPMSLTPMLPRPLLLYSSSCYLTSPSPFPPSSQLSPPNLPLHSRPSSPPLMRLSFPPTPFAQWSSRSATWPFFSTPQLFGMLLWCLWKLSTRGSSRPPSQGEKIS
jgi:hypothetical protein